MRFDPIEAALQLTDFDARAAQSRMVPGFRSVMSRGRSARQAGVLLLVIPGPEIVLTRRAATLRGHSGQISFPGGARDRSDTSLIETALRETREELGICQDIRVLGDLASVYIPPSNFDVHPVVGVLNTYPVWKPNSAEVAEVFTFPVRDLLDDRTRRHELQNGVDVPYYLVNGHKVWGATAIILSEFEQRLKIVYQTSHMR